jgi:hypothetical protein
MKSAFEYKLEILLKEWDQCQIGIARFDTLLFNIRTWSISIFSAILAGSISLNRPHLMLVALAPTMLFWLVDAHNKRFQRVFIDRYRQIEDYLSSERFIADAASQKLGIKIPDISGQFGYENPTALTFFIEAIRYEATELSVAIYYLAILGLWAAAYVALTLSSFA